MTTLPHVSGSPIDERLLTIPLIGRDDDIRTLRGYLKTAITQIIGLGGLGKSRLAAELVQIEAPPDGAIWHVASDVSRADEVIVTLRKHYKLPLETERTDLMAHIREKGADRLLVVIDNGESIDPQNRADERKAYVTLMKELRQHGAMVLLTSRQRWTEFEISDDHEIKPLDKTHASQIVDEMLRVHQRGRQYKMDREAFAEAAHCHPRMIEWAVKRLSHAPPEGVIATLESLQGEDIEALLHDLIGKTVDQMCGVVGEYARDWLRWLGVCRGGFTYASAKAIGLVPDGNLQHALRILTEWSFVTFRDERYTIDPLVIEVVGIYPEAHAPHYEHYLEVAREHHAKERYSELDKERANLEAAFAWAQKRDVVKAYWLYAACTVYLYNRGRYDQRLNWAAWVVDALNDHADPNLLTGSQNSLGNALADHPFGNVHDNLRRAKAAYRSALLHLTYGHNPQRFAMVQNNLGTVYAKLYRFDQEDKRANLHAAEAAYHETLKYYSPTNEPDYYATVQNNLGNVYGNLATLDGEDARSWLLKAEAAYLESLRFRTVERTPQAYAVTQYNLGNLYLDLAGFLEDEDEMVRLRQAEVAYQAALTQQSEESVPLDFAKTLENLGILYFDMSDISRAIACWRSAEPVFRRLGLVGDADRVKGWIEGMERQLGGS